jgi:hypothetical protein
MYVTNEDYSYLIYPRKCLPLFTMTETRSLRSVLRFRIVRLNRQRVQWEPGAAVSVALLRMPSGMCFAQQRTSGRLPVPQLCSPFATAGRLPARRFARGTTSHFFNYSPLPRDVCLPRSHAFLLMFGMPSPRPCLVLVCLYKRYTSALNGVVCQSKLPFQDITMKRRPTRESKGVPLFLRNFPLL